MNFGEYVNIQVKCFQTHTWVTIKSDTTFMQPVLVYNSDTN